MKVTVYRPDRIDDDPPRPLAELLESPEGVVWVDMTGPRDADVQVLREVFGFHPLAIEDALTQRQRPKLEAYDGYLFLTVHAVRPGRERTGVVWDEVDIFAGPRYIVTVHPRPVAAVEDARSRLGHAPAADRASADYVLYTILDSAVDTYFPVLDRLEGFLERLEDQLFRRPAARTLDEIVTLKRSLLHLRRTAAPLRDLVSSLMRRDHPLVRPQTALYLRDVFDHLLRITDAIDTHRDLITGTLDVYLTAASNRLNEVVKVLTVITAVFASLAVITGIYGMNFERAWPPFGWPYGFPAVLAGMAVVVGLMLALFRRQGWL